MKYKVKITEILSKWVEVDAECPLDARDLAEEKWRDGILFLDAADFKSMSFLVKEEPKKNPRLFGG